MGYLKQLSSQTAYYGLSSILGRLLNYLLTPFYTYIFLAPERLGIVVYLYSIAAMANVLLTYGMETAFFRFSTKEELNKNDVQNTAFSSIFSTTTIFMVLALVFHKQIAAAIGYASLSHIVLYFILIVAADTCCAIPFCLLRREGKAKKFAMTRVSGIALNIALNVCMLWFLPLLYSKGLLPFLPEFLQSAKVDNIFLVNVISSLFILFMLRKELAQFRFSVNFSLLKKMLAYALPILVVGTAGFINETMDRLFMKSLLPAGTSDYWLGVYGNCFKIAVFITLFIQAFRYAAEPFFFNKAGESESRKSYATVAYYFTIAISVIFVGIMSNMSWLQYFVGPAYRAGLDIVPIVLFANIFLGLYFNVSIWYKLTDKTIYGAAISVLGAAVTIAVLLYGLPRFGYIAAAWSHFITYLVMLTVTYFIGQKHFKVPYNIPKIAMYLTLAAVFGCLSFYVFRRDIFWGNAMFVIFLAVLCIFQRKDLMKIIKK